MFSRLKHWLSRQREEAVRQISILWHDGWEELDLYRFERGRSDTIWAPSKDQWVRARRLHMGFRYNLIQFVDGPGKKGKRSPWSCRWRSAYLRGEDKPMEDARQAGNWRQIWEPIGHGIFTCDTAWGGFSITRQIIPTSIASLRLGEDDV